eukprot:scaffold2132_cov152-Skeletonema_menzelii.AAC.1
MGKGNREKQRMNRALKRREQSTAKPLQNDNKTKDPFTGFGDKNYKLQSRQKKCALKKYIHDHKLHQSNIGLTLYRPENRLPVIVISTLLQMNSNEGSAVTKICPSDHGLNLDKRCARGLGLEPDESFEVRWGDIDGDLILMMFRNVFTPLEARAADLFKQEHATHSKGWNRGCEADLISRENTARRQVNNPDMILKTSGINQNNTLVSVGPGGIGKTTGVKICYDTGERVVSLPLCSFISRMKWTPSGDGGHNYEKFLKRSDIAASKYFAKIKSVYMDHCLAFMGNEYLDCLDSIEASLWMNTNIIDDVDSIMSIHHDPSTPTPALAAGTTNYEFDQEKEEWILMNNGGRLFIVEGLFWIDYRPTDVAIFDGNSPHGVSHMRPRGIQKCGPRKYLRFSMILFSIFRRTKMRKHGYNRK